jgi:hypothetical protein
MKTLRFLIASSAAAAFAATVHAQEVRITGSTAFRASAVAAIIDSLNNPTGAYIGSNIQGANQAVITGSLKTGEGVVTYNLAWSGSISGCQSLTTTVTTLPGTSFAAGQTWISPSSSLSAVSVTTTNGGYTYIFNGGTSLTTGTATWELFSQPDAAYSDAFITSTAYGNKTNYTSYTAAGAPAASIVGIIPFAWVKGPIAPGVTSTQYGHLTNITTQQAHDLFVSGIVPLSLITGNSGDSNVDVVLSGRNNDSGTRFAAIAEAGLPEGNSIVQYQFVTSGTAIDSMVPYASASGQSSGGNLAASVEYPADANAEANEPNVGYIDGTNPTSVPFIAVTYLGVSDAKTVATGNTTNSGATLAWNGVTANILLSNSLDIFNGTTNTYNGSANGALPEAVLIQNGQYSFWEYEHLYYLKGESSLNLAALNDMHVQIVNTDALAAGMFCTAASGMEVTRVSEFTAPGSSIR